jgi:hypothetical protein
MMKSVVAWYQQWIGDTQDDLGATKAAVRLT